MWLNDCSGAEVSDCGRYLIVSPVKDCRDNLLFFADLSKYPQINGKLELTQFVFKFEADYEVSKFIRVYSNVTLSSIGPWKIPV